MAKSLISLLRNITTKLLWLVSILVIIFVLALSIAKLSLPYWTENKSRMTELVESQLGGDFDYSKLEVDWSDFKPAVFIEDASWTSQDKSISYKSETGRIVLNFWESLFKGYLITESIEINQAELKIELPDNLVDDSSGSFNLELFFKRYPEIINQELISIKDLSLIVSKRAEDQKLQTRKSQIPLAQFRKIKKERQLIVDVRSELASQVRLVVEADGKPFEGSNSIKVYGLVRDLDLVDSSNFFNLPQGIPVELADAEFWFNYKGSVPQSGRLLFQAESAITKVASLNAEINYLNDKGLSIFSSDNFHIVERSDDGALREYDSQFKVVRNNEIQGKVLWQLEAENTPIAYFSSLSLPFMPVELREELLQLQPDGFVATLDIQAEQDKQQLLPKKGSATIQNLSFSATQRNPALSFSSVNIEDSDEGWRVVAHSDNSVVTWPGVFKSPIPVENMILDSRIRFIDLPVIEVDALKFVNDDAKVSLTGKIYIEEEDVDLSLYGEASDVDISALENYWPRNEMDETILEFLDNALIFGTVDSAKLIWRGNIDNFPYVDNTGFFDIQSSVSDTRFRFDPDWPAVDGLSAKLHFNNNELLINVDKGSLQKNQVNNAEGYVESLFTENSILHLSIDANVGHANYQELYLSSPMKDWLGEELLELSFSGNLKNHLNLRVPLGEDSNDATLDGVITFDNQKISLSNYGLELNNLSGELHYTESGAYAEALKATFWESPVTVDIKVSDYTDNNDLVNIDASSDFNLAKAMNSLKLQLPVYVEGTSKFNVHYRQDSEQSESLIVRSDLKGTSIVGPSWLSKDKQQASSLLATLYKKSGRIHSRTIYRDKISAQLDFGVSSPDDINGVIAMGELATSSIKVPATGVAIEGFFPEIDSYEWMNSLQVKKGGEFFWPKWINHILVKTALFSIAGQTLHDVELSDSLLEDDSVRFNAKAREGRGNLTLYSDGRRHVTVEQLDLELKPFSRLSDSDIDFEKKALDKWQLECVSCKINGIDTGKLTLVTELKNDTLTVQGDSRIDGELSAYLEGRWQGNYSQININFETGKTGDLLKRWGYGDGLKGTKAIGSMALDWPGGFHDFELAKLNGKVNLDTESGVVKELSDRQARVFSLFSLQSIRRRLSLDFSDLFEDGFFYDKIKGAFTIKNGVVHSDEVFIDGTAADVDVKGSINLVNNTVNQNVTVVPKLGSSLPILAGWALEPTTGLIMLIVNKLFEPVIDVVVSIEYKISGDLSNPTVTEVNKKSKEVAVPDSIGEVETEAESESGVESEPRVGSAPKPVTPQSTERDAEKEQSQSTQLDSEVKESPLNDQ